MIWTLKTSHKKLCKSSPVIKKGAQITQSVSLGKQVRRKYEFHMSLQIEFSWNLFEGQY